MRTRSILGLDFDYLGIAYLQPFSQKDLARTGHAWKKLVCVNATVVLQATHAHFKIADVNASK